MNRDGEQSAEQAITPVFLVGFMGAGKTTVGRVLSQMLDLSFFDLDDLIERRAGMTVKEIFRDFGEPHFREREAEAIRSCACLRNTIVALGGGAYVSSDNRSALRSIGRTVWLDCPLEVCLSRIAPDGSRPLASDEETMRALFERRVSAYAEADLTVCISERESPEEVARAIASLLRDAGALN